MATRRRSGAACEVSIRDLDTDEESLRVFGTAQASSEARPRGMTRRRSGIARGARDFLHLLGKNVREGERRVIVRAHIRIGSEHTRHLSTVLLDGVEGTARAPDEDRGGA